MLRRVLMVLLLSPTLVAAALLTGGGPRAAQRASAPLLSEKPPQDVDLPTKAVWFATEAFGKAAALVRLKAEVAEEDTQRRMWQTIGEQLSQLNDNLASNCANPGDWPEAGPAE